MASSESYLLSALLPGAGHIHEHRPGIGWPVAILWTACWHVILLGVWVIPRFFADWMVPAASIGAAVLWPAALAHLAWGVPSASNAAPMPPTQPSPLERPATDSRSAPDGGNSD